jgi:hypothetical protein
MAFKMHLKILELRLSLTTFVFLRSAKTDNGAKNEYSLYSYIIYLNIIGPAAIQLILPKIVILCYPTPLFLPLGNHLYN